MRRYVPKKGDFVVLTFDPQSGHEQRGRRPALIVSNTLFNKHTGLAMACPITNTSRNIPFHVEVPHESSLTGYIMRGADQVHRLRKPRSQVRGESASECGQRGPRHLGCMPLRVGPNT